jgi:HEAT repeat protein
VPSLIQVLRDNHEHVRERAASALENLGPLAKAAAAPLARLIKRSSGRECIREAMALWSIAHDRRAVLALSRCFDEPDPETRLAALDALQEIGRPAVSPVLDHLLDAPAAKPPTKKSTGRMGWS